MSRRALLPSSFGILLLITATNAKAIDTQRYFPLDHGSTWTTRTTTVVTAGDPPPPFETVLTMVPGKTVNGKPTTKLSWTSDSDATDRVAALFVRDASGTLLAANDQMEPHPLKADCLPVPTAPHLFLPAQVSAGQTFSGEMKANCDGASITWSVSTKVIGMTTTVVPAGTYRTLALRRELSSTATWQGKAIPPSKEITTYYLARGVGSVKEVTEYSGPGSAYGTSTETEVLLSTNRKAEEAGKGTD